MYAAENEMTVGRVEYAPDYGRVMGLYVERDGPIAVGEVSPVHPSGDSPLVKPYIGVMPDHYGSDDREDADLPARAPRVDPFEQWHLPPLTAANDNSPLPKVVALTGLAGSGKSTLADYLIQRHGYVRVKFAGPLKAMLAAIGLSTDHIEGDLKELPTPILQGRTPRYAMQTLGTEWGRSVSPDLWTGLWQRTANDVLDNGGRVVTDDVRFDNEADVVRAMGGVVIELKGRGGIAGVHASEQGVDADVVLRNVGSIGDLGARADEVLFGGGW